MSDQNLEAILENIEEMKQEQLSGITGEVEGNQSDNKNGDSNLEMEQ